ncbi:MAG: ATP-dependent Clp protease proteolytic subunit [Verrucomicrobiales bacterium]
MKRVLSLFAASGLALSAAGLGWADEASANTPAPETTTGNTGAPAPSTPATPTPAPTAEDQYVDGLRKELARLSLERDKLTAENLIARAKLDKELAERRADLEREKLRLDEQRQKEEAQLAQERRKLEEELRGLRLKSEQLTLESTVTKAQAEIQQTEQRMKEADARAQIAALQVGMEKQEVELTANNYANTKAVRLENPHQENTLIISDRRIALNGPISSETADYISSRLNYFNNKDATLPIFIVIDNSPGGSVMAGYNILKSMESSQAPVYVVVKSFAASMAACIATCADKSFAYPNAVVLHHQISSGSFGNLTMQRENLAEIEEWWRRLSQPVAKKMGLTTEDFVKRMYQEASSGDWSEFGDKAAEVKWIDHVVGEIRETALVKNPDSARPPAPSAPGIPMPAPRSQNGLESGFTSQPPVAESVDDKGQPYMRLPRLAPKDFYYLYNPDGYYRLN